MSIVWKSGFAICTASLTGFLAWKAGSTSDKKIIIYLVLAFLICVANACIQTMCF